MRVAISIPPSTQGSLDRPSVGLPQVGPLWVLGPHQLSPLGHPHSFQMLIPQRLPSLRDLRAGILSGHWQWQAMSDIGHCAWVRAACSLWMAPRGSGVGAAGP